MPNKKKQRAANRRAAKEAANGGGGGGGNNTNTFRAREPSYYNKPTLFRSIPDMSVGSNLVYLKESVFSVLPDERSPTCRRFAEAYNLLDGVMERNMHHTLNVRSPIVDNISDLTSDPGHMTDCVDVLRAITLTDWRAPFPVNFCLRIPSSFRNITQVALPAGSSSDVCLANVGAKDFVCLLMAAISRTLQAAKWDVARIAHELRVHADVGLDWGDLEGVRGSDGQPLTESEARFALATIGIKSTRSLYRHEDLSGLSEELTENDLLTSIEIFSRDQVTFCPESAVGYFNLGWIASQVPFVRGENTLAAAADCLDLMKKTTKLLMQKMMIFSKPRLGLRRHACMF